MTFQNINNNNNDKMINTERLIATLMEQQEPQATPSLSSYISTPFLHVTKIPKDNLRFVSLSSTSNNTKNGITLTNHEVCHDIKEHQHHRDDNNSNAQSDHDHDPICPIEFDWYEEDNGNVNNDDNNKNDNESINNNDQHNVKTRRRYVKISRIYHDSFFFVSDGISNKDNKNNTSMKDYNIKVGQIIIGMNDYHITSPQQAKEILLQCCDDRNDTNNNKDDNSNKKKDNYCDDTLSHITIVTCDSDDIILRSKHFPFLKLCIVHTNDNILHDSGCDFSYITSSTTAKEKQMKYGVSSTSSLKNNLLYVSYVHPKGLWMNSTLQCGDIVLSMNGYTVTTRNDVKHAIMKSFMHQSPIIYLYVIDFIEFQNYIYQQCIKILQQHHNIHYPYQVQFYDHCVENNNYIKNSTIDKHSQTICQIVFYKTNDGNKNDNSIHEDCNVKLQHNKTQRTPKTSKQKTLLLSLWSEMPTTTMTTNAIMMASAILDVDIWKKDNNLFSYGNKK